MMDMLKSVDLLHIVLGVPMVSGAILLLMKNPRISSWLNLCSTLVTATAIGLIVYHVVTVGTISRSVFLIDPLSSVFLLIIGFLAGTAAIFSIPYMEWECESGHIAPERIARYYGLFQLFLLSMTSVLLFENLGLIWVTVEATTLVSAILVAYHSNRSALEAAWKYIMICSVGIAMALLGTIFLYYAQVQAGMHESQALSWLELRNAAVQLNPGIMKLATAFIIIGYGAKAGLAPMHTWLPDAHSQAPAPISGLLSGALLSCAMYAMARNISVLALVPEAKLLTGELLTAFGLLSLLVAVPFLLLQHDIKRLLAYSSVENMGLVAIAFAALSPLGAYGALFQLINHAVIKSALFYVAGILVLHYHTKQILRIRGLLHSSPLTAGLFLTLLFAVSGLPPFSMFISKFLILQSLFQAGNYVTAVLALLMLVGVFSGLLYYAMRICLGPAGAGQSAWRPGFLLVLPILLSLAVVTAFSLGLPAWLDDLLNKAALIIAGGLNG